MYMNRTEGPFEYSVVQHAQTTSHICGPRGKNSEQSQMPGLCYEIGHGYLASRFEVFEVLTPYQFWGINKIVTSWHERDFLLQVLPLERNP